MSTHDRSIVTALRPLRSAARRISHTPPGRRIRRSAWVDSWIRGYRNRALIRRIDATIAASTPTPNAMATRGGELIPAGSSSLIRTRFVVLADGRTGSTLLVDELDRRWPQIRSQREILLPAHRERFDSFEDVIRDTYAADTGHTIVGCKILHAQISPEQLRGLLALDGMHVIMLRRRNELRRQVSFAIAQRTSEWTRESSTVADRRTKDRSVVIEPAGLYRRMKHSRSWFEMCEEATAGMPRLDVAYEDLADDLDMELRRIAAFLDAGEPAHEAPPELPRQNPEPLQDLIENYEEISTFLRDVGLAHLLIDETDPPSTHPTGSSTIGAGRGAPAPAPIATRFIVLSEGRTGSTLLVDELNRRWAEIRALREVYLDDGIHGSSSFEEITQSTFFEAAGPTIVGCKIFNGQLTSEQWPELLRLDALRVVVLRRRDLLRRYVSLQIATKTSQWRRQEQNPGAALSVEERRIHIDTEDLRVALGVSLSTFQEFDRLVAGIPSIDVWYEDLAADLDQELRRVATFLGAGEPLHETPPKLARQNPEPLWELVENFGEVSAFLREIGLAEFVEEDHSETAAGIDCATGDGRVASWPTESRQLLLHALLGPEESFDDRWRTWMEHTPTWTRSADVADLHPLAQRCLQRPGSRAIRLQDFRRESAANVARRIRLLDGLAEISEATAPTGLDFIVTGSTALAVMSEARGSIGMRTLTMTGLDLTTSPERVAQLIGILHTLGWAAINGVGHPGTGTVTLRNNDLELRLHHALLRAAPQVDPDLRAELTATERFGSRIGLPAPTELLLMIIIDGLLARPAGSITWIPDAHRLIVDSDSLDWPRLADLATRHDLSAPVRAAIELLSTLDEGLLSDETLALIDAIPITDRQQSDFNDMMRTP